MNASKEKRGSTTWLATSLARELFIPFTIGSLTNSFNEINALVNACASTVKEYLKSHNIPLRLE